LARKLPEYPEDALPIDPQLLAVPNVRVGWFNGSTKSSRVIATTLSPAHGMGGDPDTGTPARVVVDVKLEASPNAIIPNVDIRTLFDAEDRPAA